MTVTHTVPKTIPASNEDVTAQLNKWLAGLPNGGDVSFAGRKFRVEGTLLVTGKHDLRFRDGFFWCSTQGGAHRAHWRATGGVTLRWLHINVQGPRKPFAAFDSTRQWQHAIELEGVDGFDIAQFTATGVLGDGIYMGGGSKDGHIHATCHLKGTGRQSLAFTNAQNVQVDALLVEDPTLSIVDVEPNGPGCTVSGITVDGLRVQDTNPAHTFSLFFAADTTPGGAVHDITVKNCVQKGNNTVVVATATLPNRYRNLTFSGNRSDVDDTRAYGKFAHVDGLVLAGNAIPDTQVTFVDCPGHSPAPTPPPTPTPTPTPAGGAFPIYYVDPADWNSNYNAKYDAIKASGIPVGSIMAPLDASVVKHVGVKGQWCLVPAGCTEADFVKYGLPCWQTGLVDVFVTVDEPGSDPQSLALIRTVRSFVNAHCPGVKTAVTQFDPGTLAALAKAAVADIYVVDSYPSRSDNWSLSVEKECVAALEQAGVPYAIVIDAFQAANYPLPNAAQLQTEITWAKSTRAIGLIVYAWGDSGGSNLETHPELLKVLAAL